MGQKMYFFQAPTGFPDRGQYWINTGSLLNRMNFGLALASGRIPGIRVNLLALNRNHEPEGAEAALITYSKMIMPERDLTETISRLSPMLNDPQLIKKVEEAASKNSAAQAVPGMMNEDAQIPEDRAEKPLNQLRQKNAVSRQTVGVNTMLSQVVGIILGSPEFQRK